MKFTSFNQNKNEKITLWNQATAQLIGKTQLEMDFPKIAFFSDQNFTYVFYFFRLSFFIKIPMIFDGVPESHENE